MEQGRKGSGRLPDERFHTDNVFNTISGYVERSRAVVDLRTRERTTGADALVVIKGHAGVWRYAIQAKSLMSHVQNDVARDSDPPHYPQLGHKTGRGHRQYDLLLAACAQGGVLAGWVPIHVFYNELTGTFETPSGWACESVFPGDRTEFGVTFARTEDVKIIADARLGVAIRGRAGPRYPYALFRKVSRPWLCLLCAAGGGCPHGGAVLPPPPALSRGAQVDDDDDGGPTDFSPTEWPHEAIEPQRWDRDDGDHVTSALLDALAQPTPNNITKVRDVVRPLARAALVADAGTEE